MSHPGDDRPLLLWPGVLIVALQWAGKLIVPLVAREMWVLAVALVGSVLLGGLGVLVWWTFFSRAPRVERWAAVALVVAAMAVTPRFLHESVATGNAGFQFYFQSIPVLSLAFVVWAAASRRLDARARLATMAATFVLACGLFTLLRSEGITGEGNPQFRWRWAATDEERLLARAGDARSAPVAGRGSSAAELDTRWPGFGGPDRAATVHGVRIATDWSASPPAELWRRPIGPGVSSFAVGGDLLYTQEQRGEDEVVGCYAVATGEPVWWHRDTTRFEDAYVGAGPRATPTLHDARLYALGATGILNALDPRDGSVLWSVDAAADTGAKTPYFGFVSSPLVVGDLVTVYTNALVAYDVASGERRWTGPAAGETYGSPHRIEIEGVEQIFVQTGKGSQSVAVEDGALLWEHSWPGIGILQPVVTASGDLLVGMTNAGAIPIGTRRLAIAREAGEWTVAERWTSSGLKVSFSPVVLHRGHAYGFDGSFLTAIDVESGERRWKGGRYGSGQVVLLPDQDLLLIVSERGELALVEASPDRFLELGRVPGIEGKMWSQPALVGDVLLVRSTREMGAFRLAAADG